MSPATTKSAAAKPRKWQNPGSLAGTIVGLLVCAALLGRLGGSDEGAERPLVPRRLAAEAEGPAALRAEAPGAAPPAFGCKRILWLTGLQSKTSGGAEAHYIAPSSAYLRYYAAALRSARKAAPSLLPVLVAINGLPADFVQWAEEQGALVVPHNVSFAARMASARKGLVEDLQSHLMASFARLDVPAILPKIEAALPAYLARWRAKETLPGDGLEKQKGGTEGSDAAGAALGVSEEVDLEAVLWTDPDVLFRKDISSCSLPVPPLLSIGPELAHGTVINCGVMVFNVRAWEAALPSLLAYADAVSWEFAHDQDLVNRFFSSAHGAMWRQPWHRLTALPDAYNYKAYWGEPEGGWMGMFMMQVAEVAIVHTHGPKPEMALCVIEYLQRNVRKPEGWQPEHVLQRKDQIVSRCGIHVALYLDEILQIMGGAFKADGGAMYRWVLQQQESLCPGTCWHAEEVER